MQECVKQKQADPVLWMRLELGSGFTPLAKSKPVDAMKAVLVLLCLFGAAFGACGQTSVASTPAVTLSQQHVVDKYPDIGVAGSALNLAFVDVFNQWKTWKPEVLQRDDWPEIVAGEAVSVWAARRREEARQARLGLVPMAMPPK